MLIVSCVAIAVAVVWIAWMLYDYFGVPKPKRRLTVNETKYAYDNVFWAERRREIMAMRDRHEATIQRIIEGLRVPAEMLTTEPEVYVDPVDRALAEAVLRGDRAAACALADKVRET